MIGLRFYHRAMINVRVRRWGPSPPSVCQFCLTSGSNLPLVASLFMQLQRARRAASGLAQISKKKQHSHGVTGPTAHFAHGAQLTGRLVFLLPLGRINNFIGTAPPCQAAWLAGSPARRLDGAHGSAQSSWACAASLWPACRAGACIPWSQCSGDKRQTAHDKAKQLDAQQADASQPNSSESSGRIGKIMANLHCGTHSDLAARLASRLNGFSPLAVAH